MAGTGIGFGQSHVLVLGGDDSVPIPVLAAYEAHGPLTILQLDAHIDWREEVSGETQGLSSNMRRASEMAWVENIIQVGARGIGSAKPQDRSDALAWGVDFYPMRDVVQNGIEGWVLVCGELDAAQPGSFGAVSWLEVEAIVT